MEGNELIQELKKALQSAQESVKIVSAWINGDILEDLLEGIKQGVKVEVFLRAGEKKDMDITDFRVFRAVRNVKGKIYLNPRLHAKFLVIDDSRAFVGSANLTYAGTQQGNFEAVVEITDPIKVKELLLLYQVLKDESEEIQPDTVALVLSSENSLSSRVLLLEDLPEQCFLKTPTEKGILLCKLTTVKTQSLEESTFWVRAADKDWLIAFLKAYANETGNLRIGEIKVMCEYRKIKEEEKESYFGVPLKPLKVGTQLLRLKGDDPDMQKIMSMNLSGYPMEKKAFVGKLLNTDIDVYIDITKVSSMHMAVIGTTGAGKTTFIRRLIEHAQNEGIQFFVIDVFGEYYEKLKVNKESIEYIKIPYTLFPIQAEDLKDILRTYGIGLEERTTEEKAFFTNLRKHLKPDLELICYKEMNLEDLLISSAPASLKSHVEDFLNTIMRDFGSASVKNQKDVYLMLLKGLSSNKNIVIFDFKDVLNLDARINMAGLLMKEVFILSRLDGKKRLVILEEAHNFAPERGALDVPFGRENLSYLMAKRIALEGRKFGVGLIAITQRPANISKYILSQLNTQAVFRLITKNDLDAVSVFFGEGQMELLRLLPSLRPGTLFLSGIAVPFSMLVSIEL
jgi:GTPase SAR1 family protein